MKVAKPGWTVDFGEKDSVVPVQDLMSSTLGKGVMKE